MHGFHQIDKQPKTFNSAKFSCNSMHFVLHRPLTPSAAQAPNFWAATPQRRFYMQKKVHKCEWVLKKLFEILTPEQ